MLILSRRAGEKIVFPALDVTIDVLRFKGNTVRLGITAPPSISVLREEIAGSDAARDGVEHSTAKLPPRQSPLMAATEVNSPAKLSHALRNRLNAASLALHLFKRQAAAGMVNDAERSFQKILDEFAAIEAEAIGPRSQPTPEPKQTAPKCRALVVEDDANESELLAGYLRLSGFDVTTAGDGANALEYLAGGDRPDVVLLDMFMPRCDGPHTVSAIRKNKDLEGLKIFAVSGHCPEELGVSTGPRGIDRWFPKPVNPETLVREINLNVRAPLVGI
jgi:carbon storage regulator CsrA